MKTIRVRAEEEMLAPITHWFDPFAAGLLGGPLTILRDWGWFHAELRHDNDTIAVMGMMERWERRKRVDNGKSLFDEPIVVRLRS